MTSSNNASTLPTPLPMVTLLPSVNRPTKPTLKPTSKITETVTTLPPKRNTIAKTQSKPSNTTSKPPIVNTTKTQNVTKFEPKTLPFSMEKTLIEIFGIEPWDPTGKLALCMIMLRSFYHLIINLINEQPRFISN